MTKISKIQFFIFLILLTFPFACNQDGAFSSGAGIDSQKLLKHFPLLGIKIHVKAKEVKKNEKVFFTIQALQADPQNIFDFSILDIGSSDRQGIITRLPEAPSAELIEDPNADEAFYSVVFQTEGKQIIEVSAGIVYQSVEFLVTDDSQSTKNTTKTPGVKLPLSVTPREQQTGSTSDTNPQKHEDNESEAPQTQDPLYLGPITYMRAKTIYAFGDQEAGNTPTIVDATELLTLTYTSNPALPEGFFLNQTSGIISGIAPAYALAEKSYTIKATKENGGYYQGVVNVAIIPGMIGSITYPDAGNGFVTSQSIEVLPALSDYSQPVKYQAIDELPSFLNLDQETGVISGNLPSSFTPRSYQIRAVRQSGEYFLGYFPLAIVETQIPQTPPIYLGLFSYDQSTPRYSYEEAISLHPAGLVIDPGTVFTSENLPSFLTINPETGVISGIAPSSTSSFPIQVTLTEAGGNYYLANLNITTAPSNIGSIIYQNETITYDLNIIVNEPAPQLSGTCSYGSPIFSASGSLAPLALNPETGAISGITPSTAALGQAVTITATCPNSDFLIGSRTISFQYQPQRNGTICLQDYSFNEAYQITPIGECKTRISAQIYSSPFLVLSVSGPRVYNVSWNPALPSWVSTYQLNSSTYWVSFSPTSPMTASSYQFVVSGLAANGDTTDQLNLTVDVTEPPPTPPTPTPQPNGSSSYDYGYGYGGGLSCGGYINICGVGPSGSKVICDKLYELGYLPYDVFVADEAFGNTLPPEIIYAYHWWAKPFVRQMERNDLIGKIFIQAARMVAIPWAYAIAEDYGVQVKSNWFGRMLYRYGPPMMAAIAPWVGWSTDSIAKHDDSKK